MKLVRKKLPLALRTKLNLLQEQSAEALPSFEVMNPDLLICTMDSSAKLDIEITIGKGRGYVPAEDNKPKEAPFGYIPTDSIFTPIKNVKYSIENTRVEQRTDFEKLHHGSFHRWNHSSGRSC